MVGVRQGQIAVTPLAEFDDLVQRGVQRPAKNRGGWRYGRSSSSWRTVDRRPEPDHPRPLDAQRFNGRDRPRRVHPFGAGAGVEC